MKLKLPYSARNWISLIGATVALISFFMIVFLFAVTVLFWQRSAYIGLVIYILLPAIMVVGLLAIPIGMWRQVRRERSEVTATEKRWPLIDLNDVHHRHGFFIFAFTSAILLFASALGSYQAFHLTESTGFCGKLCHTVMKPEYTAYQESPHARVKCVECHVGPGADWYVRSKLSGLRQVFAVAADTYPRPIPTPIENLRPAREVCEHCHWPRKFYPRNLWSNSYFMPDDNNTRWDLSLVMKVAARDPAKGLKEGAHWHVSPDVRIEYHAADHQRQQIDWVKMIDLDTGDTRIYRDQDNLPQVSPEQKEMRTMDCVDCHNRPSHRFASPRRFVNAALSAGEIPSELPQIKKVSLDLCAEQYPGQSAAEDGLAEGIHKFYRENYPELYEKEQAMMDKAVAGLQEIYSKNIFPEMKARWSAYPLSRGHLEFPGCFRCHDGRHRSEDGELIRHDCNLCHRIVAQGIPGKNYEAVSADEALEFRHPEPIGGIWRQMLCSECHNGLGG
ncbi:MAG: NapC/NirT family cytochrome c [Desulfurivibrionaceae bacterium]